MSVIDDIKSISKIVNQMGNTALYQQILDLLAKIMEMQEQLNKCREENKDLQAKIKIKGKLKFENNAYWIADNKGKIKEGPFCSRCWDVNHKLIRFIPKGLINNVVECPECKIWTEKPRTV